MVSLEVLQQDEQTQQKYTPKISPEQAEQQTRLLKAIADPTRIRILNLLSQYPNELCVFDIVYALDVEQPTCSHHLRLLRDAGLVDCRKRGLYAYYYVKEARVREAQRVIRQIL